MIYLDDDINSLTHEFRARIEELLDDHGVAAEEVYTLARHVSEEFSKILVENETDPPDVDDADDEWE